MTVPLLMLWHKDIQQGSSRATQLLSLTLDRSQNSNQGILEELSICRAPKEVQDKRITKTRV